MNVLRVFLSSIQQQSPSLFRLLAACTCVFVLSFLTSCQDSDAQQSTLDDSKLDLAPSNILLDTDISFMDSLFTKAKVHAYRARVFNDKQETLLDSNVVVRFFNRDGSLAATLTCDHVRVDNRTNNMYSQGHVIVDSQQSMTHVETNSMMWDNARGKLYSNEYVKITKPNELIEGGVGFESDQSMSNYRIFKVSGVKQQ